MIDFLGGLVARATGASEAIAPRVPTCFEPVRDVIPPAASLIAGPQSVRVESNPPPPVESESLSQLDARFAAIDAALRRLSTPQAVPAATPSASPVTIEPRLERVERTMTIGDVAPPPEAEIHEVPVRTEATRTHEIRATREVVRAREQPPVAPDEPSPQIEPPKTETRTTLLRESKTTHERHERAPAATLPARTIESHHAIERTVTEPAITPAPVVLAGSVTNESVTNIATHHRVVHEQQMHERVVERGAIPPPVLRTMLQAAPSTAPEPSIHISIGRIEVRAQVTQEKRTTARAPAQQTSLDEYMQRREDSGR